MEAAQTSALALYVGLNLLLTFLLAVNVVRHRFKGDSADPVMLEKAVRAHGNNTEYVPIILIGLGVMAMTGASAQTISILGGTLFVARIFHSYGIQQTKIPNIFGMVGNIVTWLVMLCVATTLLMHGIG
jgi:uncharacterized membrane protein YecN with MAPEG domain